MMKKMPILLIAFLILVTLFGKYVPVNIKSFLYSISLTIQNFLIFSIPVIIIIFVFRSIVIVKNQAFKLIFLFMVLVYVSNFIASLISLHLSLYLQGDNIENITSISQFSLSSTIQPLWKFHMPKVISSEMALLIGALAGVFLSYIMKEIAEEIAEKSFCVVMKLIRHFLVPIIPIFILGFLLKMQEDNVFCYVMQNHSYLIANTFITCIVYILFIYLAANNFNIKKFGNALYNMLPATITAFISMSSNAALPYTIEATEKNTNGNRIVLSLVPPSTNMHLVGDCFFVPAYIVIILNLFNYQIPYSQLLFFLTYYALMKFAVVAIPGGGILTVLPIIESQLNFSPQMLSLITAIYFLLDGFSTSMNVFSNGGFCLLLNKFRVYTN